MEDLGLRQLQLKFALNVLKSQSMNLPKCSENLSLGRRSMNSLAPRVYKTAPGGPDIIQPALPKSAGGGGEQKQKLLALSDRTRSSSVSDNNWKRSLRKERQQPERLLPAITNPAKNRMTRHNNNEESSHTLPRSSRFSRYINTSGIVLMKKRLYF